MSNWALATMTLVAMAAGICQAQPASVGVPPSNTAIQCAYGVLYVDLSGIRKDLYVLRKADRICFKVDPSHEAWLILPLQVPPAGKRPWVWYAPQILGEPWIYEKLLQAGFAVGGVGVGETHGNPKGRQIYTAFYEVVTKEFGLDRQACLMPQSRGGLMLYNWAAEHPEAVRCIGGIYPVCDIRYWPPNFKETCAAYGLTEEQMKAQLAQHNPVERLEPLARRKIPIFHITGSNDGPVPKEKHSLELQRRYRELGGPMEVEIIPGKGHQECPEIFHSQRLIDFFLQHGLR